jgi:hypothetical protein
MTSKITLSVPKQSTCRQVYEELVSFGNRAKLLCQDSRFDLLPFSDLIVYIESENEIRDLRKVIQTSDILFTKVYISVSNVIDIETKAQDWIKHCINLDEPYDIYVARCAKEKEINNLLYTQELVLYKLKNLIQKDEENKQKEREELERKKQLQEQTDKEARERAQKREEERKEKLTYALRCRQLLMDYEGVTYDYDEDMGLKELNELIIRAHTIHNERLLRGTKHNGCGYSFHCFWVHGHYRCNCGHYKGFSWKVDDEDLMYPDFTLDSRDYVGFQAREW